MSAHAIARSLVDQWFSRFATPGIITTDQDHQFEADLFSAMSTTIEAQHIRTSSYNPQVNGMVEPFHRTLMQALTTQESVRRSERLPIVLLALRSTVKPDIGSAPAEMVYGTTLLLPGELFHPAPLATRSPNFITTLRDNMAHLRVTNGTNHDTKRSIFVPKDLSTVSHVFLRVDAVRLPLQPRFDVPFAVLQRRDKDYKLQLNSRQV